MTPMKMPQLGETVIEGTILKWLKQEGDQVARDEPLFEISTDKVDTEVPSPAPGTLTKILVPEGETVAVGTELAEIPRMGRWRRGSGSAAQRAADDSGGRSRPRREPPGAPRLPPLRHHPLPRHRAPARRGRPAVEPAPSQMAASTPTALPRSRASVADPLAAGSQAGERARRRPRAGRRDRDRRADHEERRARLRRAREAASAHPPRAAATAPAPAPRAATRRAPRSLRPRRSVAARRSCRSRTSARQIAQHMWRRSQTGPGVERWSRSTWRTSSGCANARRRRSGARGLQPHVHAVRDAGGHATRCSRTRWSTRAPTATTIARQALREHGHRRELRRGADRAGRQGRRRDEPRRPRARRSTTSPTGPAPRSSSPTRSRRHVHDHEPRAVRLDDLGADHQPAADRDPGVRRDREAAGRDRRRDRDPAHGRTSRCRGTTG